MYTPKKICHLTSVHPQNDIRVFKKECVSLAKHGYEVKYIVLGGNSETKEGVDIIGLPYQAKGRLSRALEGTKLVLKAALKEKADLYHIHDPEMMSTALKLKAKTGAKVICDIHEYTAGQIKQKHYIPSLAKPTLSKAYEWYESKKINQFDGVILAVPFEGTHLAQTKTLTEVVYNYPLLSEFKTLANFSPNNLIYVGGITNDRGFQKMLKLLEQNPSNQLKLAGKFHNEAQSNELFKHPLKNQIDYRGFLNRQEVAALYHEGGIGLLLFNDQPNLRISLPIKLFEYMAAGLPVVVNDFPHWKEIVEKNHCGICVNPQNTEAVFAAVERIQNEPELALEMGKNGRALALSTYNWAMEEKKLVQFYEAVLAS